MIYDLFTSRRVVDVTLSGADVAIACTDGLGPRAIWVGGAGVLKVKLIDAPATTVSFTVPAGTVMQIQPCTILSSGNGTTATEVKLMY
jgi:hypothetical protein